MIFEVSKTDPGRARIVTNDGQSYEIDIKNVRHGFVYDTILIPAGAIANGSRFEFYRDIAHKNELDCSVKTSRRLSTGQKMVVTRVGIYMPKTFGQNAAGLDFSDTGVTPVYHQQIIPDENIVFENCMLEVKTNSRLVTKGPAVQYPAGFGVQGILGGQNDLAIGQAGSTQAQLAFANMHNGFPVGKLQADLMVEQVLDDKADIEAYIEFQPRNWIGTAAQVGVPTIQGATYGGLTADSAQTAAGLGVLVRLVMFGVIWGND